MAGPNFLGRVKNWLGRALGQTPKAQPNIPPIAEPPAPEPRPPPTPTPRPPTPAPIPQAPPHREQETDDHVSYHSRSGSVLPRWHMGGGYEPPGVRGLLDMMEDAYNDVGSTFLFAVTGTYYTIYPGKEAGEITLSYVWNKAYALNQARKTRAETVTDWLNEMLAGSGEYWEEVTAIDLIDVVKR